uniref:ATP-dependent RNA helicase n=2 Tax=Grammatophora oceanica TaxID=210454 RepID=A0A7S1UW89_9STRA|mmetsp:Transcript_22833/g.33858  ORF Transcript_22833/g.33858 Transcript_22833/m.33858 type:complete len:612 (+) Transcript_22833:98-1933(+)
MNTNGNSQTEKGGGPRKGRNRNRNRNNRNSQGAKPNTTDLVDGGEGKGHSKKRDSATLSNANGNTETSKRICRTYAKTGACKWGEKCRFDHVGGEHHHPSSEKPEQETTTPTEDDAPVTNKAHISSKKFADLSISAPIKRSLAEVFKYECMTVVQAETLPVILRGTDVLAKAKTGTGKTLGFLIPAIELMCKKPSNSRSIPCLVLSPTRELAMQISKEAVSLSKFLPDVRVVTCVGGTNINRDKTNLKSSTQILVSTPGRLLDHLANTDGLGNRLGDLKTLIFDEADQLLDMGFRPDIERILKFLEPSIGTRQTLLFSATVPDSVNEIAKKSLRSTFEFIDTVGESEEQTHMHVKQELVVVPQANVATALEAILARETGSPAYKVIVFFTTARLTGFMADLFNAVKTKTGYDVLQIHSRMSQPARKRCSDKFRTAKQAVLFSSDVSARGMDYPNVSFVLQVGLTERAQYIHRLGRTARAGKRGQGCLLLTPYEEHHMMKVLNDMPIEKTRLELPDNSVSAMGEAMSMVANDKDLRVSASAAYRAWIGYYNAHTKKLRWDKRDLVEYGNQWALEVGLDELPTFEKKTVGKMGLKGVPGLVIEARNNTAGGRR